VGHTPLQNILDSRERSLNVEIGMTEADVIALKIKRKLKHSALKELSPIFNKQSLIITQ
jgi:hypothetical protein